MAPALTLHAIGASHPSNGVAAALRYKGLEFERVDLAPPHAEEMERVYGAGHTTVPGLLIGDEPVHGSVAILSRLEELAPDPPLYPEPIADAVRAAERWGDGELQDLGRRLPWGALHFRPEALGTFGFAGAGVLAAEHVDFAMKFIHVSWKYHRVTAARLAEDLQALPALLDEVDALADRGVIGSDQPTAADFQIGATVRILLTVEDLVPVIEGRPAERIARRWLPDYPGHVPAGAYPAGWVPAR